MAKVTQLQVAQPIVLAEEVERSFNPATVDRMAEGASDEDLSVMAQQVRTLGRVSWTTFCIVCGHLVKRAVQRGGGKRTRRGMAEIAKTIDAHISDVSRAVSVYERIIKPRVERDGIAAQFPVNGRTYYELAADAERFSGKPALEYLEVVEDRLAGGRFSVREFRQFLIDEGAIPATTRFHDATTRDESTAALNLMGALMKCSDDSFEYLLRSDAERGSRVFFDLVDLIDRWRGIAERLLQAMPPTRTNEVDSAADEPFDML